ncbi:MAG: hypothetical protein MUQ10_15170, partial [Anaerolineae bacterium]|nr:hypothetical protein [Anaerolineae bacterium]
SCAEEVDFHDRLMDYSILKTSRVVQDVCGACFRMGASDQARRHHCAGMPYVVYPVTHPTRARACLSLQRRLGELLGLAETSSRRGHRCGREGWSPKKTIRRIVSPEQSPRSAVTESDSSGQPIGDCADFHLAFPPEMKRTQVCDRHRP